jgi:tRNA-binding EMAP/Myf-like protein
MRVPISWLREFVDVPLDVTHEQVHAALVKVGFEEEDVHTFDLTGPVVVGQILEFTPEPQANGKTINWCQVDVGDGSPRGIVCGAHNFVVGDKLVVSLPGAVLPGPFPISARKTYGHVSDGMIASARELGLGDEHDGILRLASLGLDPELGTDAIALLGLDDFAVEVNVTPDRGYAFSIRGIAREYASSTGTVFRDPADAVSLPATEPTGFSVTVDDAAPDPRARRQLRVHDARRAGRGPDPADSGLDGRALDPRGHPLDLTRGRHHELRHARARPAYARLRPRQAHGRHRRAPGRAGGDDHDPRRQGAHPRSRRPAHHRRVRPHRPRRGHGRGDHRDRLEQHQRARRGRELRSRLDRAHLAPAQAAERGESSVRTRRRSAHRRDRERTRRRTARRAGRRHGRSPRLRSRHLHGARADRPARRLRRGLIGVDFSADEITSSLEAIGATVAVTDEGLERHALPPGGPT